MYGIMKKETRQFFVGFNSNNQPIWTSDKTKAWSRTKLEATCQANFLASLGAQKKPVSL